jgi:predicted permease
MNGYNEETGKVFYRELRQRLAAAPGVAAAALASWFPLGFEGGPRHQIDVGSYLRKPGEDTTIPFAIVTSGYFDTLQIPLIAGRDFTDRDDATAAGVAVINETMAKRFWPGQDPLGRTFKDNNRDMTVIGVAKDGKYRSLNETPSCFYYRCYLQGVWDLNLGICVRTTADPSGFGDTLRREIQRLDAGVEVWGTQRMTDFIAAAFVGPGLASRLLRWLGVVALILAALGVYGVMSFVVGQRTQEFGVRIALGANLQRLLSSVLVEGLLLASAGIVGGLVLSIGLARVLASAFYGVDRFDFWVFSGVTVLLGIVAVLASYLPARRATKINPIEALRAD